ncbi:hypothetical protein [Paraflavitalea pollutisoli]|uniref:hypothetical protein n=1 Tax=Paraflavitalea pollutisoli TaxID=3034143 RepID=UPI0023ECC837|nr:hypothetical protein [Paraflavitalea sp. H1-2-19X]
MQVKLFILLAALASLAACKKDTPPATPADTAKKPGSFLVNWEYNGSTWVRSGYLMLDLDHASNKDKSYMVFDLEPAGGTKFKFVLKKGPLPIDSLATNWPASVRSVAFGYGNDMTVNAAMRLQAQTPTKPYTFRYDSIHKFSTAIYLYNYLNNPLYAGTMAGKNPQGRASGWGPDAAGNASPRDIIYYFRESAFSDVIGPGRGGIVLTDLVNGVNTASTLWKEVDAVLTFFESAIYHHLYFDFDNWRYFVTYDWCPASYGAPCTKGGVQVAEWRNMNDLMTWPAGWGK